MTFIQRRINAVMTLHATWYKRHVSVGSPASILYKSIAGRYRSPSRDRIQLLTVALHCTDSFIITLPPPQYDVNKVDREVKQTRHLDQKKKNAVAQSIILIADYTSSDRATAMPLE